MNIEYVDVLVVGAGLAGVGAACHIKRQCPNKSMLVLEAADQIGGTWNTFRYPGIRSDSDMQTLGYSFRPWRSSRTLADGASILEYIRDTAREYRVDDLVRTGHRVVRANWASQDVQWRVTVENVATGHQSFLTCAFLHICTGYYDHQSGYLPAFEGLEDFGGDAVHPQHWPPDLDYRGKRIVVIGSGATAVTLVPALARSAAHVTMLQRSPSYVVALPSDDGVARILMRWLPDPLADRIVRFKNVLLVTLAYRAARYLPQLISAAIRAGVRRAVGDSVDVERDFTPRYEPWQQRVCFVPDGDLFDTLRSDGATIVTDQIARFTRDGIELATGGTLPADIIVTATGLNMKLLGGAEISVDGVQVDPAEIVAYKGMMLTGVPNLSFAIGYTNASWTLKCDLVANYVCRLLNHMDARGHDSCTPIGPGPAIPTKPFVDLTSGYIQRSLHLLPRQAAISPWRFHGNYFRDSVLYRRSRLDNGVQFARRRLKPTGIIERSQRTDATR